MGNSLFEQFRVITKEAITTATIIMRITILNIIMVRSNFKNVMSIV